MRFSQNNMFEKTKKYKKIIVGCIVAILFMVISFIFMYQTYIQKIIYEERLNQMDEVTHQMFLNLEDVMETKWDHVKVQCNIIESADIRTTEDLSQHMKRITDLYEFADSKTTLLAVDDSGKYYTEEGNQGIIRDAYHFEHSPKEINYVSNFMTTNESRMVFLKKLEHPIRLQSGQTIKYYGLYQNMHKLNEYFGCDAYENNNSVYILDDNGFKLFNSNKMELIKGHNVFTVLKKMEYLHDSSFDKTEKELKEKGVSYSNAILDGTEYFYVLKKMDHAAWTLIFLVPAKYVATNTVRLVKLIIWFIILFAFVAAGCMITGIVTVLRKSQSEAIEIERENNTRLETINTELTQAKQAAEQAFEVANNASQSKSDFLASMSHDIRTPMNAIIGITSLIRHDAGNEVKVTEYADKIDVSAQHLLGIINDVLDMSKIEAGKTVFRYTDFSILEFMQEIQMMFRPQAEEKHQILVVDHKNIVHEWINSDYVHLMQIFSNLFSNAVKYTQEGGKIQFLIEEYETKSSVYAKYHFVVIDNGVGMPEDFKDKIFDAFTRAESSLTNKIQGTGLGMAITKNLIEAMGGSIDVESELGRGSCFEVFMDLKIAEDQSVSSSQQIEKDESDDNIMKGMRFLCAEDNELNAEILTELLKIEGAECTVCENGERILEAFERSAPGDYDMILMDIQMPVMNGYEATKAIRKSSHELAKTIPIIAMTANAFSEDIHHSLASGMNAHVSKPVEIRRLKKTIRSIKFGGALKHRLVSDRDGI